METLRTYLDSLFAKLPDTAEVRRAREEIWQMMEDQYEERIQAGDSENEAIGKVISEIGSLDELSEELGLELAGSEDVNQLKEAALSMDEVQEYIKDKKRYARLQGIGVALCICSVIPPILGSDWFTILMFLLIGVGVGIFIVNGILFEKWNHLEKEGCLLDFETTEWVREEGERYRPIRAILLAIGVMLCVVSVVPPILFDELPDNLPVGGMVLDANNLGAACLFLLVAVGVLLIVWGSLTASAYSDLLKKYPTSAAASATGTRNAEYIHPVIARIMSVYWVTATCIYLSWSFLSFDWDRTWIIWPVAAVLNIVIDSTLRQKSER